MNNRKVNTFLSNLTKVKSELIELLLLVIMVAFGVNLLSTYIAVTIGNQSSGILGGLIIVLVVGILFCRRFFGKTIAQRDRAVISVKENNNKFLNVKGYKFNRDFGMILDSLFVENVALKKQWSGSPLGHVHDGKSVSEEAFIDSKSQKLAREITEYIYLYYLSVHLSDYFNSENSERYDKKWLINLSRDDISDIVTSNRVLDMISKDMNDRVAFERVGDDAEDQGEIIMSWLDSGAVYAKFDLTLPKGSVILREKDGSITIKNSGLKLNFKIMSEGHGEIVDYLFEKYYMNMESYVRHAIKHYTVDIVTTISIKPSLAIFSRGVRYQLWSESFVDSLLKKLSFAAFLEDIKWKTVNTILTVESKKIKDLN